MESHQKKEKKRKVIKLTVNQSTLEGMAVLSQISFLKVYSQKKGE